jgi:hypothetical protein
VVPSPRISGPFVLLLALAATVPAAAQEIAVPLAERARGADRVVVGRVESIDPVWRVNEHGDRLIVSVLHVVPTEILKGQPDSIVEVDVEGGTIDGLTLRVSDLPEFQGGERAVFYLRRAASGRLVPHLRGQGLLKLDDTNRVRGSSLTLDALRRSVAASR